MRYSFLLVLLLLSGCIYPPMDSLKPDPDIKVVPNVTIDFELPPPELKDLVTPLRGIVTDKKDALKVANFFLEFADVIKRDEDVITTTAMIREGFIRAEKLMLQRTSMVGKYPGFGAAKDNVIKETIGLENVELDDDKRKKAVDAFKAIAWAVGGNDG